jgi:hypothetical protein
MNKNWPRWIFASVAKHFTDAAAAASLPMYVESAPTDEQKRKAPDWSELRIDGPSFSGQGKDQWGAMIEVNVVVSSAKNEKNNYRILQNIGVVCEAFAVTIPILKLGDGPDDDQSFITCLQLLSSNKEIVKVSNFGQITPSLQLLQSTVEGHYHANLEG